MKVEIKVIRIVTPCGFHFCPEDVGVFSLRNVCINSLSTLHSVTLQNTVILNCCLHSRTGHLPYRLTFLMIFLRPSRRGLRYCLK